MTLPVTLPFHVDESTISLVSRLANANGFTSAQSFLMFTYTSREAILRGDFEALSEISNQSDVSIDRLTQSSIVYQYSGSNWKLGHATFNKEMRPGKMLRFCAQCIIDDIENGTGREASRPYSRSWWYCRGIEGCPDHNCRLVEIAVETFDIRDDLTTFVAANIHLIREHATNKDQSSAPELDRYLRDRIFQNNKTTFINDLGEHIVYELSRYLGDFIGSQNLSEWQSESTDQREWGFLLASKGRAEIERVFAEVIDQTRPTVRLLTQFFGPIIKWLRRNETKPAYNEVVLLFQQIAEKSLPLGPGMTFIRPVEKRYLYCVNTAHEEFKIDKKRIKSLIVKAGLITRTHLPNSSLYFDAAAARPIFEDALKTLNTTDAADILGIHQNKFRELVKAGLLPQVEERQETRCYIRIQQMELNELQSKLLDRAENTNDNDGQWIAPQDFARDFSFPLHDLLKMVLNGMVKVRVISGSKGVVERLRINKEEVRLLVHQHQTSVEEKLVTFEDALTLLGTSDPTLMELIKLGYVTEKHDNRTHKRTRFFNVSSIRNFKDKYISLVDLCNKLEVNRAGMKGRLAELGIFPLFDKSNRVASYYARLDLMKVKLLPVPQR